MLSRPRRNQRHRHQARPLVVAAVTGWTSKTPLLAPPAQVRGAHVWRRCGNDGKQNDADAGAGRAGGCCGCGAATATTSHTFDTEQFSVALRVVAVCDNLLALVLAAEAKVRSLVIRRTEVLTRSLAHAVGWRQWCSVEVDDFGTAATTTVNDETGGDSRAKSPVGGDAPTSSGAGVAVTAGGGDGALRSSVSPRNATDGAWDVPTVHALVQHTDSAGKSDALRHFLSLCSSGTHATTRLIDDFASRCLCGAGGLLSLPSPPPFSCGLRCRRGPGAIDTARLPQR